MSGKIPTWVKLPSDVYSVPACLKMPGEKQTTILTGLFKLRWLTSSGPNNHTALALCPLSTCGQLPNVYISAFTSDCRFLFITEFLSSPLGCLTNRSNITQTTTDSKFHPPHTYLLLPVFPFLLNSNRVDVSVTQAMLFFEHTKHAVGQDLSPALKSVSRYRHSSLPHVICFFAQRPPLIPFPLHPYLFPPSLFLSVALVKILCVSL